ncbi:MAG: hypothetical protein Fur0032_24630 [Terrimicrobiaceae bacterium]
MVPSFRADFVFGWSNLPAAEASTDVQVEGNRVVVTVDGRTTGAARVLWQLDVHHHARFQVRGLASEGFCQVEKYKKKTITTKAVFQSDGVWRLRTREPDGGPAKWKRISVPGVRDIVAAMFFVRSQALEPGDQLRTMAFPGDSAFLVDVQVVKRESIAWKGGRRPAVRLEFRLQKVLTAKGRAPELEAHGKFRKGTVWMSDDDYRIPLRAEVDIFIGFVFAELTSISFR